MRAKTNKLFSGFFIQIASQKPSPIFGGMASLIECVRACQSAVELHVYLRYAEELAISLRPFLFDYISRRCHPDSVEDVLQETLSAIAEGAPDFRGKTERELWSWCYRIAGRKIGAAVKERKKAICISSEELSALVEAGHAPRPLTPREKLEIEESIAVFDALDEKTRVLVWKCMVLEWDYATVGKEMGMSAAAVGMAVRRGIRRAEKALLALEAGV